MPFLAVMRTAPRARRPQTSAVTTQHRVVRQHLGAAARRVPPADPRRAATRRAVAQPCLHLRTDPLDQLQQFPSNILRIILLAGHGTTLDRTLARLRAARGPYRASYWAIPTTTQ